ncbi:MAG TPA: sulfatase [Pirellulaceae bacterium]|jgi:arylsulfatase A-like enzyme|nr:sulfatase [Pirellulaceae bacterium]
MALFRTWLPMFMAATASWIGLSGVAAEPDAPARRNVLFLIADDLNCDLGCYGHPRVESPNIDALASRGVLFERAYCQYPLCSPSRTSFLTGLRPDSSGVHTNPGRATDGAYGGSPHFREFHPDLVTLPQFFRNQGYFAARVGKLYHYGVPGQIGTSGLDDPQSWDKTVNPIGRDKTEEEKVFSLVQGSYGGTLSWLAAEGTDAEQTDAIGADAAIELLKQQGDKPFFLAVGFYRPHTPYVAPKAYFEKYPKESIDLPPLSEGDRERLPAPAYASAKKEQEGMSDDLRREAIQAYWASISFMDAQVGRVLAALEEQGLADETIVVMTSDHGYHMYDHGLWQKMSVFENSARVPLIIALPDGKNGGQRAPGVVELIDLYPTLADLCGFEAPSHVEGTSLVPTLQNPQTRVNKYAFTQVHRGGERRGYSVRTEQFRYTWWGDEETAQLYDMQADPQEAKNLAGDPAFAEIEAELRKVAVAQRKESPPKQKAAEKNSPRKNERAKKRRAS